jgi:hypothetical protein
MSIGYNPHFGNTEKTAEPWLLHNFDTVGAAHATGSAEHHLQ